MERRTTDYKHCVSEGKSGTDWADDRPCATSKRTSDTKFPEGDPMFVADPDGCKSSEPVVLTLTVQSIEQRYTTCLNNADVSTKLSN